LHRENTAERTTSTAGQPAGSTVVHGHSPPPVSPFSQLETVVHGHSPPPAPPFSQLETDPWPQSTTSTTVQPTGDCDPWPQSTTRTTSTAGQPTGVCGPFQQPTTSTTVQPTGDCDPWPQPTTRDSSFWWLYSATVGSVTDQPLPRVQPLTEDGRRCLPELLDFAGDQASFCGFTDISKNSDLQGYITLH